jgi:hypothetical protein
MKGYRIQGINRLTGEFTVAQVAGYDMEQAMQLFGLTHHRLLCVDKIGVEL